MIRINKDYGNFLGSMEWNYIATWRPYYHLTTFGSDKRISELAKHKTINRVFFALEKDMNPDMSHAHILLQANAFLDRQRLARYLNVNLKQVSYFQPVIDHHKVADYCAKEIGRNIVHYNYFQKGLI